jgi:hypothetical protein
MRVANHDGRDLQVRTDRGAIIAEYEYRKSGHAAAVTIGDRGILQVSAPYDHKVRESLESRDGKELRQTTVASGTGFISIPAALDSLGKELGLGEDWSSKLTFKRSASNKLTVVADVSGRIVLFLVNSGAATVGFLPDGTPAYFDISIDSTARPNAGDGSDAHPDSATDLSGVVPDHVVLTRSGMIGLYVSSAADGGISSIWTERASDGGVVLRHRTVQRGISQDGTKQATPSSALRRSWRPI